MAPSLNTKTLSLCSFFSLLLFLHVCAREMKVEEELTKQTEASAEAGKPYITGYIKHKKVNQPYLAGYIHSQNDKKEKSKPYITAYGGIKGDNQPYITQYINGNKINQPYLTGYRHSHNDKREENEPHMATYGESKKENRPYITGYIKGKKVDQSYLTGYLHSEKDQKEKGGSYITGYGESERENKPYITGYIKGKKGDQSYLTGYLQSQKDQKEKSKPYITSYGGSKRENQAYITGYIKEKKVNQPYITAYGGSKKDSQGENPTESYAATYARGFKDSYAATYRKEESGNTDAAINKGDHTEAFKTGFFAMDDLYVGSRMTLQFPIEEFPHFLTRKEADSIPFSTSQLPSVLQLFSVPQDSPEAQAMGGTLDQCELQPLTAETKVCVSSSESMIDFVRSIIGSDSQLDILTTTLPATSSVPLQNFTVLEISPDIYAPKWVACHPLPYPYAVFYCHFISSGTKVFKVKLGSENGEQMEALGVCHLDTSEWSPDHILFEQLGFKPGEAPVCHFFPMKHLMWVPLPSKATV